MNEIAAEVLRELIKRYESSKTSRNENQIKQTFSITLFSRNKQEDAFAKNQLGPYTHYDGDYDFKLDCEDAFRYLENQGYCKMVWHGESCERISLNLEKIDEIYAKLGLMPKSSVENLAIDYLLCEKRKCDRAPLTRAYIDMLIDRLQHHLSTKKHFESVEDLGPVLLAARSIEENEHESYLRNFSKHLLGDSKVIEKELSSKIMRVFNESPNCDYEDFNELLADHHIFKVKTPTLIKGPLVIEIGQQQIDLGLLEGEFALSASMIDGMKLLSTHANKVITIENQTTFYDFDDKDALIVYLGGYASGNRIALLKALHDKFPQLRFFHFGDIDWGGFEILFHLRRVTGIDFGPLHMDIDTVKRHKEECAKLDEGDCRRLCLLLEKGAKPFDELIEYMLKEGIKLEQESLSEEIG